MEVQVWFIGDKKVSVVPKMHLKYGLFLKITHIRCVGGYFLLYLQLHIWIVGIAYTIMGLG